MHTKRLAFIFLSTGLACCTAWYFFGASKVAAKATDPAASQSTTPVASNGFFGDSSTTLPTSQTPSAASSTSATAGMLQAFNKLQSARSFIHEAIRHPESGGIRYANRAWADCINAAGSTGLMRGLFKVVPGSRESQAEAAIKSKCDITDSDLATLKSASRKYASVDPLSQIGRKSDYAKTSEAHLALAKEVISAGSPILFDKLKYSREYKLAGGQSDYEAYFDGKWYRGGNESAYTEALILAQCEFGMNCGPDSLRTLAQCSDKGWCANSLAESVRIGWSKELPQHVDAVFSLRDKIVAAIKAGDASAFAPGL
ncbi:hypothetical protein FNU76_10135 [Chitinimonas arctica]|uniref:Uncharacterized protein n=1 Tax=Chitinimonas arctica TaxID=2594795 RepID=A0A516SEX0_9NEIS|nr:hypothetical protein [Chitinimonas arctica]QDQ26692.1 hypothetical protein FNU76_10135 [Chitinimonas arctica]